MKSTLLLVLYVCVQNIVALDAFTGKGLLFLVLVVSLSLFVVGRGGGDGWA